MALAAMHVFLIINGIELRAPPRDVYDFIMTLHESDSIRFRALATWLHANTRRAT